MPYNFRIMLKWLAIVAVFLAVAQTASPIPRKAPDHPANASSGVQSNGNTNQNPTNQNPAIPQPIQTVKERYDGPTGAGENKPQPIAIREFPPVSIAKDWADKSYWVFSGLLVLVGGFQVWLLWRTWKAMQKQTTQLERQVRASHDGLRAWVGVAAWENQFTVDFNATLVDKFNEVFNPSPTRFEWEIKNFGQTPAFIKKIGSQHTYAKTANLDTLPPPTMHPMIDFIGAGRGKANPITIEDGVLGEVLTRLKFWRFVIKIEYRDAFDQTQIHETMVSFHYYVSKGGNDPIKTGFYQENNPANNYNN